jgi:hypothetical protein
MTMTNNKPNTANKDQDPQKALAEWQDHLRRKQLEKELARNGGILTIEEPITPSNDPRKRK